jgi:TBC1 domain family member 10
MDSHLRPYFSSNAVQLDIDASLFAKAVETVNPSIAKKLFVDMGIAPIRVCRPWSVSFFFPPENDNLQFVWS